MTKHCSVVYLRKFRLKDAMDHLLGDDDENIKWLSGGKSTLESVQAWIRKNENHWKNNNPIYNFAIIKTQTNELVGMIEANADPSKIENLLPHHVNIAYGIYPKHRKKGLATAACLEMLKFLQKEGYTCAILRIDPNNLHSVGIPLRLGFQNQGIHTFKDGEKLQFSYNLNKLT